MQEIWKDIVGYEGLYQVSNLGNVRSLNYNHTGKEKLLKQNINCNGYNYVVLAKEGSRKTYTIHRLVAIAFIPKSENKDCVDHINGIRTDNRVVNLRWATLKENMNFPLAKKHLSESLTNHPNKSKSILQIDKVTGEVINEFPSSQEAGRQLNVSRSSISACCNGKYNSAYGYIWKYK